MLSLSLAHIKCLAHICSPAYELEGRRRATKQEAGTNKVAEGAAIVISKEPAVCHLMTTLKTFS